MNCLSYALRFWSSNPDYRIYYNNDHCINLPSFVEVKVEKGPRFLPLASYGYEHFSSSFAGVLSEEDKLLLARYFGKKYDKS